MLFKLVRAVDAGLVLAGLVEESASNVFASRFDILMAPLVYHRPTAGALVALQTDAIDEAVTL